MILDEVQRVLRDKFKWPAERVQEIEPCLSAFTRRVAPTETLDVVKDDPHNRIIEFAKGSEQPVRTC